MLALPDWTSFAHVPPAVHGTISVKCNTARNFVKQLCLSTDYVLLYICFQIVGWQWLLTLLVNYGK